VYFYAVNNYIIDIDVMADNMILCSRFVAQLLVVRRVYQRLRRLECLATVCCQECALRHKAAAAMIAQNIQVKTQFVADECSGRNGKALRNRKYGSEEIRSQGRKY
jgi:transcription elongation factor Elf1